MISLIISDKDGISLAAAIEHVRNMLHASTNTQHAQITISLENYTKGFNVWLEKESKGSIKETYTITLMPEKAKQ